jgi:hypothetical protein
VTPLQYQEQKCVDLFILLTWLDITMNHGSAIISTTNKQKKERKKERKKEKKSKKKYQSTKI